MFTHLAANLERYMDALSVRQRLVASNIANADTPGYKTRDLEFQAELQASMDAKMPGVIEVAELPTKTDGNNVNLDREARLLAENALRFNLASNLARAQVRLVRAALQEGKAV